VTVPCDDPGALRRAVLGLIEQPGEAALLAKRARAAVLRDCTLARWISRIGEGCAVTANGVELTPDGQEKPDGRPSVRV